MSSIPAHYGMTLTPTTHTTIPPNLNPSTVSLPHPFIAVVTGAGKGLGYHISLAFARAGCTGLSISSRTLSDLDKLEREIKKERPGVDVLKSVCDVRSEESVGKLEGEVRGRWGRVDVVVANAGVISNYVTPSSSSSSLPSSSTTRGTYNLNLPIGLLEDDDWARVLDINLNGTWRISKAFLPLLIETKRGAQTLICSSSLASHSCSSEMTPVAYNVSKMACNRLMEHVARDHGGEGVQAFALHPGAVLTPQTQNHKGDVWGTLLSDDEGLAGAMCVWLSKEKREWLSGRYVSCNWDVDELEGMREEIEKGDKLKFRMTV